MLLIDLRNPSVTQGLLAAWLRCRREARLFLEGWTPRDDKEALEYGILAHEILAMVYGQMRRKRRAFSRNVIERATQVACKRWAMQKGTAWGEKRSAMHELQATQMEVLMPRYFEYWKHADERVKWAAPEQTFSINRGRFTLRGRIDGAWWMGKSLRLLENKNWSFIPEEGLLNTLGYDLQMNFYCLALSKITGVYPTGATLNILRRPGIAIGKKGLDDYADRLSASVDKDPGHYFMRFDVAMPRSAQNTFQEELDEILEEFADWLRSGKRGTVTGMPCCNRGSLCKYVPICHHGITSIYTKRKTLFPELED